jgi:hypothetical protein
MPNREEIHQDIIKVLLATNAAATGTQTSASMDLLGFDSAMIGFDFGATAPLPTSYKLEESDDNSAWNDVAAGDKIDDGAVHAVSTCRRVAYVGQKRYVRGTIVLSASTVLTIIGHRGYGFLKPTLNPA